MNIIGLKVIISILLICIAFIFWKNRNLLQNKFEAYEEYYFLGGSWVLFRLIPFFVIYIIASYVPQSDVEGFWKEASASFNGSVVYRDFWCPYSPLYPYFLAFWLLIWYNAKMLIVVMMLMDGFVLYLTNKFFQNTYTKGKRLWLSVIYLLLPGSLMLCVIGGQEDIWMWGMLVAAILLRQKYQSTVIFSVILAIGLLLTKAIFVFAILPLFWIERKKWAFVVPMLLIGVVTISVLFPLVGWAFLQPLDESVVLRAPNVLSVLNPLTFNSIGVGNSVWNYVASLGTIFVGVHVLVRMKNEPVEKMLTHFWVVLFATMMIIQQSAYSNYLFLFLMPLLFGVINWDNNKQVYALFLLNILCVIHPSWWWRIGMPKYYSLQDIFFQWQFTIDYLIQVGIVGLVLCFIKWTYPARQVAK